MSPSSRGARKAAWRPAPPAQNGKVADLKALAKTILMDENASLTMIGEPTPIEVLSSKDIEDKDHLVHLPPQRCFIASEPLKAIRIELQEASCDFRIERVILAFIVILDTPNVSDTVSNSFIHGSSALQVRSRVSFT
jgi:hypothetical protein